MKPHTFTLPWTTRAVRLERHLGSFFLDVFAINKRGEPGASRIRAQIASRFLPYGAHFSKSTLPGSGQNRRKPRVIALAECITSVHARNLQLLTVFQKVIAVWLFAHTAQAGVYNVLYLSLCLVKFKSECRID